MDQTPLALTRGEAREVDRLAIDDCGLPGLVLMENAGAGVARLLEALGIDGPVAIACGRGNNGGDGLVVARHLDAAGHAVRVLLACRPEDVRGDAAVNLAVASRSGLVIEALPTGGRTDWERAVAGSRWVVDSLLGTGARGAATGTVAEAIRAINGLRDRGGARVLAVDLPSGLDCDTGTAAGACVRADATATFVARKKGFDVPGAEAFTGTVHVVGIGAPRTVLERVSGPAPARGTSRPARP